MHLSGQTSNRERLKPLGRGELSVTCLSSALLAGAMATPFPPPLSLSALPVGLKLTGESPGAGAESTHCGPPKLQARLPLTGRGKQINRIGDRHQEKSNRIPDRQEEKYNRIRRPVEEKQIPVGGNVRTLTSGVVRVEPQEWAPETGVECAKHSTANIRVLFFKYPARRPP